MFQDTALD